MSALRLAEPQQRTGDDLRAESFQMGPYSNCIDIRRVPLLQLEVYSEGRGLWRIFFKRPFQF
jgi:hypothetical protein